MNHFLVVQPAQTHVISVSVLRKQRIKWINIQSVRQSIFRSIRAERIRSMGNGCAVFIFSINMNILTTCKKTETHLNISPSFSQIWKLSYHCICPAFLLCSFDVGKNGLHFKCLMKRIVGIVDGEKKIVNWNNTRAHEWTNLNFSALKQCWIRSKQNVKLCRQLHLLAVCVCVCVIVTIWIEPNEHIRLQNNYIATIKYYNK